MEVSESGLGIVPLVDPAAGLGGASHVTTVDVAPRAIELARETWRANGLADDRHEALAMDVPTMLAARTNEAWDLVVADPPNFAPNARSVEAATKSYETLYAACLSRLAAGGYYLAASCSSHVDAALFAKTLREGAKQN